MNRHRLLPLLSAFVLSLASQGFTQHPSAFDLRTAGPGETSWVVRVLNQLYIGDCWTFGTSNAMESSLLRQGFFATSERPPSPRLSVWHEATRNGVPGWLSFSGEHGYSSPGNEAQFSWGGSPIFTIGYLSRGQGAWPIPGSIPGATVSTMGGGPVLIRNSELNRYPVDTIRGEQYLGPVLPKADQPIAFLSRKVLMLDQNLSFRTDEEQRNLIKSALQRYSSVATSIAAPSDWAPWLDPSDDWYHFIDTSSTLNHEVAIIGWDDSIETRDPDTGIIHQGAWLAQNSWGDDWGNAGRGLFWGAYDDKNVGKIAVAAYQMESLGRYTGKVLQNQLGVSIINIYDYGRLGFVQAGGTPGSGENSMGAGVLRTAERGYLGGVGLVGLYVDQPVEVRFYRRWTPNGPAGEIAHLGFEAILEQPGYFVFDLQRPHLLQENESVVIVVDYGDVFEAAMPYELAYSYALESDHPRYKTPLGLSYTWTGDSWLDLATAEIPGVFFVKGLMLWDLNTYGGPFLANSAPYNIPGRAVFRVDGQATNLPGARIGGLTFSDGGLLEVNDQLLVAPGLLTVDEGVGTIVGGQIIAPRGIRKLGDGILDIYNEFLVQGNAVIEAGDLRMYENSSLSASQVIVEDRAGLVVNGTIRGNLLNLGYVAGIGTVDGSMVNSGTLYPGNSPGTFTITGDYTQTSTGSLAIEIFDFETHDRLQVGGTASLAGSLQVFLYDGYGTFAYGDRVNILEASAIEGGFDSIEVPVGGFRGRFVSDGGTGSVILAPTTYTLLAQTENQFRAAQALDTFIPAVGDDREVVSTALDSLRAEEYPNAFEQVSPGFYQALTNITVEQWNAQGQMLQQRTGAVRLGSRGFAMIGFDAPVLTDDGKTMLSGKDTVLYKDPLAPTANNPWGIWVQGNGIFARAYSVSDLPNYRFESGGFLAGGDYRWSENFATGVFTGYQGTYARFDNGSNITINAARFGAYATYDAQNGFYLDGIVAGGYSSYRVKRTIEFGDIDRSARSRPDGGEFSTMLAGGYDWEVAGFTFGPIASVQYTYAGVAPFSEYGADSLDLDMGQQNANSIRSTLGGRIAYTAKLSDTVALIPEVRMSWQHEFLQNPTTLDASLGGANIGYATTAPARDAVFAGAGLSLAVGDRWNASAYYNTDFGRSDYTSHMVSTSLNFRW